MKADPESGAFHKEAVGNAFYIDRHNQQMYAEGKSFSGNERDKLFFNKGDATFLDLSALSGCDSPNDGRAAIGADFDDDGDIDLFVHDLQRERHNLYRNDLDGRGAGFLKVRLRATRGQHEAIGATVAVAGPRGKVAQVLARGAGFLSGQAPELVFGLGAVRETEVEVRWPGGGVERFGGIAAGSRVLLVQGAGKPELVLAQTTRLPDPLPLGLELRPGDRVPDLRLQDEKGETVLVDVRRLAGGKRLYLNFWATYCAPCVNEIPALMKISGRGEVRVAAISVDAPSDLHAAADLLRSRGAKFPCWFLGAKPAGEGDPPGVEGIVDLDRLPIPTTLVLSPEGRLEEVIRGPVRGD